MYYSGEIVSNGIVTDVASGIDNIKSFYFGKFQVNTTICKNLYDVKTVSHKLILKTFPCT